MNLIIECAGYRLPTTYHTDWSWRILEKRVAEVVEMAFLLWQPGGRSGEKARVLLLISSSQNELSLLLNVL